VERILYFLYVLWIAVYFPSFKLNENGQRFAKRWEDLMPYGVNTNIYSAARAGAREAEALQ
tara:strand:- start:581 stop:763 length:183 start_codon:yes stop_codon:yes gene_type:complete